MVLQRRKAEDARSGRIAVSPDSLGAYWAALSDLTDFLSVVAWPDGTSRQTGTLMVFMEDGLWKCWLNDRDGAQGTFVSSPTVDGLLRAADACINDPGHPWRMAKQTARKRS